MLLRLRATSKKAGSQTRSTASGASNLDAEREQLDRVPKEGLEPSHPKAQEPKSCVSASSTTSAVSIAFLTRSQTKSKSARSLVQDSGPPA